MIQLINAELQRQSYTDTYNTPINTDGVHDYSSKHWKNWIWLNHFLKMFAGLFFFFNKMVVFDEVLCSAGVLVRKWAIGTLLPHATSVLDFHKSLNWDIMLPREIMTTKGCSQLWAVAKGYVAICGIVGWGWWWCRAGEGKGFSLAASREVLLPQHARTQALLFVFLPFA